MRILQIVSAGYEQGGIENGLVLRNAILRSMGHTVQTLSSDLRPDVPHFSDHEFRRLPERGVGKLVRTTFNLEAYRLAKRVAAEFQPDIVTLHTLHQPSASVLYALRRHRLVLCVHGPEEYTKWLLPWFLGAGDYRSRPYDLADLTWVGKAHYAYFRWLVRPLFMFRVRRITHVLAFSRYTQQRLAQEGIEATYIPNGVNLMSRKPVQPVRNRVGFAGRLERHKGVERLLEVVAIVANEVPDVHLAIAGEGAYGQELVLRAAQLRISENVSFLGRLTRGEMQDFYHGIDLFLMASSPAETFGKVGVEALSTGTPVLAPPVGGIDDWLSHGVNGLFVSPDDPVGYAARIVELLGDRPRLRTMGQHAVTSAQRFDMHAYAAEQQRYFERIVSGSGKPASRDSAATSPQPSQSTTPN